MSKNIEFKLNLRGLNELMKSSEMQGILNDAAADIAASAGDGYEVEASHNINFIAIAAVHAATPQARKECSDSNSLLKAVGGTRL